MRNDHERMEESSGSRLASNSNMDKTGDGADEVVDSLSQANGSVTGSLLDDEDYSQARNGTAARYRARLEPLHPASLFDRTDSNHIPDAWLASDADAFSSESNRYGIASEKTPTAREFGFPSGESSSRSPSGAGGPNPSGGSHSRRAHDIHGMYIIYLMSIAPAESLLCRCLSFRPSADYGKSDIFTLGQPQLPAAAVPPRSMRWVYQFPFPLSLL